MSTVTLKNIAACAIIIPGVGSDIEGLVAPGDTIKISSTIADCDFVKHLIHIGELDIADMDEEEEEEEEEQDN